jgi:hypothetical protein
MAQIMDIQGVKTDLLNLFTQHTSAHSRLLKIQKLALGKILNNTLINASKELNLL